MIQTTKKRARKTLDPAATRRRIIDAAFASFGAKGYGATSIGDIALAAGVQKSLVQYHFGNKEDLWQACLADRAAPVIEEMDKYLAGEGRDIGDVLEARFNMLRNHPELRKTLAWASMETVPIPAFIQERRARLFGLLASEPGAPKFSKLLLAIAAMDGWFVYGDLYRQLIGPEANFEEMETALLKQIRKVASKK